MHLIGMLDSPYVRRVAIALHALGIPFSHRALSVFRDFEAFAAVNPVVKAPTLVTDSGVVLMDSTLILEVVERMAGGASLCPTEISDFVACQRTIGLALAACEKSVQIIYERKLRPADKLHQPWVDRVTGQLLAAYRPLEAEAAQADPWLCGPTLSQADITTAVAWQFTQANLAEIVSAGDFPHLSRFSTQAEQHPAFRACPVGG